MQADIWIAIIVTALGTFAMRALPLMWTQRHFNKHKANNTEAKLPTWIGVLGPLMIAAMLGVSLIPKETSMAGWLATVAGTLLTVLIWRKTRTLGLPVLAGVLAFGGVYAVLA